MMAASTIMSEENHVDKVEKPKLPTSKDFEQKFLDYFYQLADDDGNVRKQASVDIIRSVLSPASTESKLLYTVGRLVQGLASTRQHARHGFYVTLTTILTSTSTTQLPNHIICETVAKRLAPKGSKSEKIDQHIGQVLAYGALLKSGRVTDKDEVSQVITQVLSNSKHKTYIQSIGYTFVIESLESVGNNSFKGAVWPVLKEDLALSWDQHNLETLNLLLAVNAKFPKTVKGFLQENLGCQNLGDSVCFEDLAAFLMKNTSPNPHPVMARVVDQLHQKGTLLAFWTNSLDPKLQPLTKSKGTIALNLLKHALQVVEDEQAHELLTSNVLSVLTFDLMRKDDPSSNLASDVLVVLKAKLTKEDITAESQVKIIEQLLSLSENVVFDRKTDTRFIAEITPSLKKEAVHSLSAIYRKFISENQKFQDRNAAIQYLARLVTHPAVQREEVEWKAEQLIFLAELAYFNKSVSSAMSNSAKENFYRALDSPCKRLEDLATVLTLTADRLSRLLEASDLPDETKSSWKDLLSGNVQKIRKKQETSAKSGNLWVEHVFLVLFLNMGLQMFREPKLAAEIIEELNACYRKAVEKKPKSTSKTADHQEPHWLEVVTDILLSLLSQNQHVLRSIVLSVWSSLVTRLTPAAVQQVLDVIDPTKKETPLVDADAESSSEEESGEEVEEEEEKEEKQEQVDEEFDDSDGMDDEEPETVTDKLRARIHEALGDGAALTDTESVDIDDLSDGEMQKMDDALAAAFREFRKARPVRKNNSKLPKDVTALMHFRLRCLDLIEVLASTDKGIHINLAVPTLLPLLSLLEATVKEPLQKPLMDRTRAVLRKVTNIRRFAESSDPEDVEGLVKLLQALFTKSNAKKLFMPYIGEDLALCCTFVLRCSLHLSRPAAPAKADDQEPRVQMEEVYQLYHTNLSKFFRKRDSPIPSTIFSRALQYPWPDGGFLLEPLIGYAFGSDESMVKSRKLQALSLLTLLFRNTTALSALGSKQLCSQLLSLLENARRVLDNATKDTKPRFICDLFTLLALAFQCCNGTHAIVKSSEELDKQWQSVKTAVTQFTGKRFVKERDIRKGYAVLARHLNLPLTLKAAGVDTTAQNQRQPVPSKTTEAAEVANEEQIDEETKAATPTNPVRKTKRNRLTDQERKEAKKRRMVAGAEGVAEIAFAGVNIDDIADTEENKTSATGEETSKEPHKGKAKKEKKKSKAALTDVSSAAVTEQEAGTKVNNGDVDMEEVQDTIVTEAPSKKTKKRKGAGFDKVNISSASAESSVNGAEDTAPEATKAKKGKEELNGRMDDSAVSIEEEEQCLTTIGDASGQLKKKSKKVKRKTEGL